MAISFTGRISITPDTLFNEVGGESVLLNLKSEQYFGLDEIGTQMWKTLTTSDSIQAAYEVLLAEYEVEPDRLAKDLTDLIEKLLAYGLIEVKSG